MVDPRPWLPRLRAAQDVIGAHVRRTPNVFSYTYSESAGRDVHLKLENLQRTGSFKIRGALHRLLTMDPSARAAGLVAASAGNHAQGVALAARLCDVPATIVMPETTAIVKVQRTEGYGAQVLLEGHDYDAAQRRAGQLADELGRTLVHPFDDEVLIAGQGTVGLEILDELPDVETIVVPVGGGGLLAGIALAVKALAPQVRIVGVQAAGAAPTVAAFHGRPPTGEPRTIAEGIRVGTTGGVTLPLIRALVDDCVVVSDEEIADAVVQLMEKSKVIAEAAGAAGIAAVAAGRCGPPARTCVVVSGGNIDLNLLSRLIESGLARAGRWRLLTLRLPDVPGQLNGVLAVLARESANVLDVQHYRAGYKVPVGFVDVEILIETRHAGEGERIRHALRAAGFDAPSDETESV